MQLNILNMHDLYILYSSSLVHRRQQRRRGYRSPPVSLPSLRNHFGLGCGWDANAPLRWKGSTKDQIRQIVPHSLSRQPIVRCLCPSSWLSLYALLCEGQSMHSVHHVMVSVSYSHTVWSVHPSPDWSLLSLFHHLKAIFALTTDSSGIVVKTSYSDHQSETIDSSPLVFTSSDSSNCSVG